MFVDTPLVSNNNLALLRCGYMCAGTQVHISRHLGKTSNNNNKRCRLRICSMLCHVCMYRVLFRISDFMIIILYLLISCLSTCVLFHQSPTLILSYYEYFLLDINCCISTCSCMLMPMTRFSMHVYDSNLSIHVCLSILATWHSHQHLLGSSDSPGSSCPGDR